LCGSVPALDSLHKRNAPTRDVLIGVHSSELLRIPFTQPKIVALFGRAHRYLHVSDFPHPFVKPTACVYRNTALYRVQSYFESWAQGELIAGVLELLNEVSRVGKIQLLPNDAL
jgi:hypothetical protein